jgi:hypothetical protein
MQSIGIRHRTSHIITNNESVINNNHHHPASFITCKQETNRVKTTTVFFSLLEYFEILIDQLIHILRITF